MTKNTNLTNSKTTNQVTASDRLGMSLFLASIVHGLVVFGIIFEITPLELPKFTTKSIEITLAHQVSHKAPETVDFLAQANQQGSGRTRDQVMPTTQNRPLFPAPTIQQIQQPQRQSAPPPSRHQQLHSPTTSNTSTQQLAVKHSSRAQQNQETRTDVFKMEQRAQRIASLTAQLEQLQIAQAKRPKRRHISAATHEARDALYLDTWRRRIEYIGNLNYPDEARKKKLSGELRLLVAINPDGTLNEIKIRQSSGQRVLDDAAIRIVKLAAPFDPITKEMRKDTDILEIIRTWQFKKDHKLMAKG